MDLITKFREIQKRQKAYTYMMNVVGWDSNTEAPRGAFARRAEMMGIISGEMFRMSTSEEYQEVINSLYEQLDDLDDLLQREVKKAKKGLDKIVKVPEEDFVSYQKLLNLSQKVWEDAKENNDWEMFQGNLKEIIEYNKKFIGYYQIDDHPYNVLLDDFEEGMSMVEYDKFFTVLKEELVPFVKEVLNSGKHVNKALITDFYPRDKQKEFSDYVTDILQFDRTKGLMKESVHPFTWNTHPSDVRFTTRYLENFVFSSIFATIHEMGHALYEQQIDEKWNDTFLNGGTSMGLHESQSRFYENIIGRSEAFWSVHLPKFKEMFPKQLKDIELDEFLLAVNNVEASFIRVEADELTYPLHIMLRYEIERMLFSDEITVDDLPEVWNKKMVEYLGIEPKTNADGVLQDVHWSAGLIGYFPTYALGTAYSAQIYYSMLKEIDVEECVRNNDIKAINMWLKEKIHQYGSSKTPKEILLEVTNEEFNPMYYVRYLKEKYTKLYL